MANCLLLSLSGAVAPVEAVNQNLVTIVPSDNVNLSDDVAAGASGARQGGGGMGLLLLLLMFVLMLTFMRPRQDKEGDKFRNSLQLEQDVMTSTGIFGKVKAIDEVSVTLEVAQGMRIKVAKSCVNPIPTPQPAAPEKKKKSRKEKKAEAEAAK